MEEFKKYMIENGYTKYCDDLDYAFDYTESYSITSFSNVNSGVKNEPIHIINIDELNIDELNGDKISEFYNFTNQDRILYGISMWLLEIMYFLNIPETGIYFRNGLNTGILIYKDNHFKTKPTFCLPIPKYNMAYNSNKVLVLSVIGEIKKF